MGLGLILCVVALAYLLNSLTNDIIGKVTQEENKYKAHIGEQYVIDKDTLTIVDYSIWEENFTLSNGRKVSYVLVAED